MSHKQTTYTVVCSFWVAGQAADQAEPSHGSLEALAKAYEADGYLRTTALEAAHDLAVQATAAFAEHWWTERGREDGPCPHCSGVGFTVLKSWGGGAGWKRERGVTVVLGGLTPDHEGDVRAFAAALRDREGQEAVALFSRNEAFRLV